MANPQIQANSSLILQKLSNLLSLTPPQPKPSCSPLFHSKIKNLRDLSSTIEPRQVLMDLIDKSQLPRKNWKNEEMHYLLFIIDKYCQVKQLELSQLGSFDWRNISEYLPSRSSSDCQFKFLSLCPNSISNTPWLPEQRQLLLKLIQNNGQHAINWKLISQQLYHINPNKFYRTGKQCREHYACFLRPNLKKGAWSESEDYELICLFLKYGRKWSKMVKTIQGRNENSIKNRFFLMFQNRSEHRLANYDLIKIVKRRKQRLQKNRLISFQTRTEEQIITNSQSDSYLQEEYENQHDGMDSPEHPLFQPSEIFIKEQPLEGTTRDEQSSKQSSEQFQKYINF